MPIESSEPGRERLDVANRVLAAFAPDSRIERRRGGWYVVWSVCGHQYERRWQTAGSDFYPVWKRGWCHGGTACMALSQLIRWLQRRPVLPLSSWRYWATPRIALLAPPMVDVLERAGYPPEATCVLCQERIRGSLDWWSLGGVSGPSCSWADEAGCRARSAARRPFTTEHTENTEEIREGAA